MYCPRYTRQINVYNYTDVPTYFGGRYHIAALLRKTELYPMYMLTCFGGGGGGGGVGALNICGC